MQLSPNFKLVSTIETGKLHDDLVLHPDLWNQITDRQTTPGSPHKDTQAIILRWAKDKSIQAVFNDIDAVDYPAMQMLPSAIDLVNITCQLVGSKKLGRAMIVNLKPGGSVDIHADEGAYADYYERFHIVISSSSGNFFTVMDGKHLGETNYKMKTGEIWWFNHKKPHFVHNTSKDSRIHLIIDCVAPSYRVERE